jgi:hypothetical protein
MVISCSGPVSSTNGYIPQWSGIGGNLLSTGLSVQTTIRNAGSATDTSLPTEKAVRDSLTNIWSSMPLATTTSIGGIQFTAGGTRFLREDGSWIAVTGGGGTYVHSELTNLDYASSGHTGFAPTSHTHTLVSNTASGLTTGHFLKATGATTFAFAAHGLTYTDVGAAATSHTHGNITNAGAIGSTSGLPVITTTSGVLTTGSFGSSAGTFCQGNDSRLSDARTPVAHALVSSYHTASGLTTGYFLKATGATTFGFTAHGLTYSDVGAAALSHTHAVLTMANFTISQELGVITFKYASTIIGTIDSNGYLRMKNEIEPFASI